MHRPSKMVSVTGHTTWIFAVDFSGIENKIEPPCTSHHNQLFIHRCRVSSDFLTLLCVLIESETTLRVEAGENECLVKYQIFHTHAFALTHSHSIVDVREQQVFFHIC